MPQTLSLTCTHTGGVRGQIESRGIPDKPVAWRTTQREEWQLCRAFTTLCGVTKQSLPFSRLSKTPLCHEERAFISHTFHACCPSTCIHVHTHTFTRIKADSFYRIKGKYGNTKNNRHLAFLIIILKILRTKP